MWERLATLDVVETNNFVHKRRSQDTKVMHTFEESAHPKCSPSCNNDNPNDLVANEYSSFFGNIRMKNAFVVVKKPSGK